MPIVNTLHKSLFLDLLFFILFNSYEHPIAISLQGFLLSLSFFAVRFSEKREMSIFQELLLLFAYPVGVKYNGPLVKTTKKFFKRVFE